MIVVAVNATAAGDTILVSGAANSSGAFMAESPNPLGAGVYTAQATDESGTEATAPLVIVEAK